MTGRKHLKHNRFKSRIMVRGIKPPLALLILGADLDLNLQTTQVAYLAVVTVCKLLAVPLLFLPPAIFFQINCSSCNTAIKINNVKQDSSDVTTTICPAK